MTFEVEVTEQASNEAEEAFLWMSRNLPEVAANWFEGLVDAVNSLANFPSRCALAPESKTFKQEIRQLLYSHYRILYTIEGNNVYKSLRKRTTS
jgi:plasmid stabilization system protein ParE